MPALIASWSKIILPAVLPVLAVYESVVLVIFLQTVALEFTNDIVSSLLTVKEYSVE